ncbi:MAG: DUF4153 domain-containing protein [Brevundimonas sp.]|uniref:DUF4153 domain-containing protein n=1 Tax=Brevundimonas sp. TaxID=1871086 RepID=UPI004033F3B7
MTDTADSAGRNSLGLGHPRALIWTRAAVGLLQGGALWWLQQTSDAPIAWPATIPPLFVPLLLCLAFVPVILIAGVGRMRLPTLALWAVAAAAILALLGWHEVASRTAEQVRNPPFLNSPMPLFAVAALFIGHHLVLAGDLNRRWIAPFAAYFDTAWKSGVQLALSIGFTGAFWILMFLGAALFRVIGLTFLEDLLRKVWFSVPITTLAFAVAVHLTDVSDGIIRGVRTVALMLLSWLLLLMTLLAAGFVAALPFTGLKGLWDTGYGTSLVLAAVAALIVLINTAYQDGRAENRPPRVLQWAVRIASVLLLPLCFIIVWGLALRIGQYGLTPDRIIAGACALVGVVHAVGYTAAAVPGPWARDGWMRRLEPTNIAGAVLALLLIIVLFSPVADPARLSVADQVARLERGITAPDKFDYLFLRHGSGQAGAAALERLARSDNPAIASRAKQKLEAPQVLTLPETVGPADIFIEPAAGMALPPSFLQQKGDQLSSLLSGCIADRPCPARTLDLDTDGFEEVLVAHPRAISVFKRERDGRWIEWANYLASDCAPDLADLQGDFADGRVRTVPPIFPDIAIGELRLRRQEGDPVCPAPPVVVRVTP